MPDNQLDFEAVTDVAPDKMTVLLICAKKLEDLVIKLEEAEAKILSLQDEGKQLELNTIPDLMKELGITELRMTSGRLIKLHTEYYANISEARSKEAMKWLRDHNMGSVIKSGLVVPAENELALTIANISFEKKEGVHPRTLKTLVKEQCELPASLFPKDLFGVFIKETAIVK